MPASRRARSGLAAGITVPWVLAATLRITGTERGFPLVPALSFVPYAAVTAVLPLAATVRTRSRAGVLAAGAAVAVLAASVLVRAGRQRPGTRLPDGDRLRIATISLRLGLVDAGPVLDLVPRHHVDVLAVAELTPEAERELRDGGIDGLLPHAHVLAARPGAVPSASGAVWSRRAVWARGATPGGFEQPWVRLATGAGRDVEITAVHTRPPSTSPTAVRNWTRDLAALPGTEPGVLRVLAGDFNATLDHAALRAVLRRGYLDAAWVTGRALAWTWRPLRLRFPRLAVDHVLVDPRISVAAVEMVPVPGSDHRAVVADLVLPRD
jgi:hypothetical protein